MTEALRRVQALIIQSMDDGRLPKELAIEKDMFIPLVRDIRRNLSLNHLPTYFSIGDNLHMMPDDDDNFVPPNILYHGVAIYPKEPL